MTTAISINHKIKKKPSIKPPLNDMFQFDIRYSVQFLTSYSLDTITLPDSTIGFEFNS